MRSGLCWICDTYKLKKTRICIDSSLHGEFEMLLSDGGSDDDIPLTLPTEGSHTGSIRKVRHLETRRLSHTYIRIATLSRYVMNYR